MQNSNPKPDPNQAVLDSQEAYRKQVAEASELLANAKTDEERKAAEGKLSALHVKDVKFAPDDRRR